MPIVCSDDQVVFSRVLQDVGEVVTGFAGDPDPPVAEDIAIELLLALVLGGVPPAQVLEDPGEPVGAGLKEAPAEGREPVWNLAPHEPVERSDGDEAEAEGGPAAVAVAEDFLDERVAVADVHGHGNVEAAGLLIEGVEVGAREELFGLNGAHGCGACAALDGVAELFDGGVNVQQRQHGGIPQPALGLTPDVRQPAVIAAADRRVYLRPEGDGGDEQS